MQKLSFGQLLHVRPDRRCLRQAGLSSTQDDHEKCEMTSFLPLLEAFLALALTMLVLTIGVSSLSGTWQRARRLRAFGLREMLRSLYLLEISKLEKAAAEKDAAEKADDGKKAGAIRAAGDLYKVEKDKFLRRFIADMSLQPGNLADIRAQKDKWDEEVKKRIRLPVDKKWLGIWSSLGNTLDTLSEDEFKTRFKAFAVGKKILSEDPSQIGGQVDEYYKKFVAYGQATTEGFSRDARLTSFICAAILAMGANIDAFNLLETYIAQPALRGAIIEKYENISAEDAAASSTPTKAGDGKESKSSLPDKTTDKINELAALAIDLSPDKKSEIENMAKEANDLAKTTETAYAETRQVVAQATMTFPVGWSRYPGCFEPNTDPRCKSKTLADQRKPDQNILQRVVCAFNNDSGQFSRWAFGVFLTIVMLGLGTPFWIQTVNGLLRGRDLLRGGNQPGDGSKPQTQQTQ